MQSTLSITVSGLDLERQSDLFALNLRVLEIVRQPEAMGEHHR